MRREIPKPNIVEVLEHLGGRVISPDRGGWRKATCVLHEDKNPSASVNEEECRFSCFVCDFSGDAVDLIMEAQGVGLADAIAVAEGFSGGDDGDVRGKRGRARGVSRTKGNRRGGGRTVPPWLRI